MKAALLCPGPCLVEYPGNDGYDLVIGVNRAAGFAPCDIWSMFDHFTYDQTQVIGTPRILTRTTAWSKLSAEIQERHEFILVDEYRQKWRKGHPQHAWTYSATAAACMALREWGVELLEIWGCQLEGVEDFDGGQNKKTVTCRSSGRWQKERVTWRGLHGMYKRRMVNKWQTSTTTPKDPALAR